MFSIALVVIAVLGMTRIALVESYWADAPSKQWRILDQAKVDLQSIPAGSTVILDGVCPYDGPAVVFEAGWDWASALGMVLGREVNGDVISSRSSISSVGLVTSIYKQQSLYPFGERLYVYNPAFHVPVKLSSAAAAAAYFSRPERKAQRCPTSYVGQGVLI